MSHVVGIIGGTGLYELDGLVEQRWVKVDSPFGTPSDEILVGRLGDTRVAFLPRHGRGHRIPPHEIPYAANVDALKRVGATCVVSVSAVGSLRAELPPGTFVFVDQFIDRTLRKPKTFFGSGCVAHVSMGHPTCARVAEHLTAAARELELAHHRGGTYVVMEGPQFSSVAESEMHRAARADVVGMTNMPEAKLAREAELCYATIAMVTDFDCWHPDHDHVTVDDVVRVLRANAANARALLAAAIPRLAGDAPPCPRGCDRALDFALLTPRESRDPALVAKLDAVAGRVLRGDA
jgi:5'-methylthioadenosine phosphorylase